MCSPQVCVCVCVHVCICGNVYMCMRRRGGEHGQRGCHVPFCICRSTFPWGSCGAPVGLPWGSRGVCVGLSQGLLWACLPFSLVRAPFWNPLGSSLDVSWAIRGPPRPLQGPRNGLNTILRGPQIGPEKGKNGKRQHVYRFRWRGRPFATFLGALWTPLGPSGALRGRCGVPEIVSKRFVRGPSAGRDEKGKAVNESMFTAVAGAGTLLGPSGELSGRLLGHAGPSEAVAETPTWSQEGVLEAPERGLRWGNVVLNNSLNI